jgi:hypothetical protein
LRTDKNNNFKFTIKFLMTLDRSYVGYLGFLGIDLFKSVLMYSNSAICLIKLLFDLGLFTVCLGFNLARVGVILKRRTELYVPQEAWHKQNNLKKKLLCTLASI